MTLDLVRQLRIAMHQDQAQKVSLRVSPAVAFHLQNNKRESLYKLEEQTHVQIVIHGDRHMGMDGYVLECFDRRGGVIKLAESTGAARAETGSQARRPFPPAPPADMDDIATLEDVLD